MKQNNATWQVVAGPGTAFEAEDMQAAGVPQALWLGNPEDAIAKLLQTTTATTFTLDVRGIDHNYARVELVTEQWR